MPFFTPRIKITPPRPPTFRPETERLLGPTADLLKRRLDISAGFDPVLERTLGGFGEAFGGEPFAPGPFFEAGGRNVLDILGGRFDPTRDPEGFNVAFETASDPLLRAFGERILPEIRSQATRAGVPQGSGVMRATELASEDLLGQLEQLAGNLFGQERRFGGEMLSRALGAVPTFEAQPFAAPTAQLQILRALSQLLGAPEEDIMRLLSITSSGPTPGAAAAFPSDLQTILGGARGIADLLGSLRGLSSPGTSSGGFGQPIPGF